MNLFLDSSALAKRYIADEESERIDALLASADSMGVLVLAFPEIVSALNRRRREGRLSPVAYRKAKGALEADLEEATVLQLTGEVLDRAVILLERHPLRSSDALHVAAAAAWRADRFVSADARQCAAARGMGLAVVELR